MAFSDILNETRKELDWSSEATAQQIVDDLKNFNVDGFNYYTYIAEVKSRGHLPLLFKDIKKLIGDSHKTCIDCKYNRGQFGDKYLCRKPNSPEYMNESFVDKKEMDNLDYCIDFALDINKRTHKLNKYSEFNPIWDL